MNRREFIQNIGIIILASALPTLPENEFEISRSIKITCIKPNTTISYLSDYTLGIEPQFSLDYTQRIKLYQKQK